MASTSRLDFTLVAKHRLNGSRAALQQFEKLEGLSRNIYFLQRIGSLQLDEDDTGFCEHSTRSVRFGDRLLGSVWSDFGKEGELEELNELAVCLLNNDKRPEAWTCSRLLIMRRVTTTKRRVAFNEALRSTKRNACASPAWIHSRGPSSGHATVSSFDQRNRPRRLLPRRTR
jgi:hypothetical protein